MKRRKSYNKYSRATEEKSKPVTTEKGDRRRSNIKKALALTAALGIITSNYDYRSGEEVHQ